MIENKAGGMDVISTASIGLQNLTGDFDIF